MRDSRCAAVPEVSPPATFCLRFQRKNEFPNSFLARLYPFLEQQNDGGISLLFSTSDFLNVLFLTEIQKVWRIIGTLSLLFTSPVSKMDKVELSVV